MPEAQTRKSREYETIYILRPDIDPDSADRVATRVSDVIGRLDGRLVKVDIWGKRKLAYPVHRHTRGVFVFLKYLGHSGLVAEIERNLRMLDQVIKYQTIVMRGDVDAASVEVDPEDVKFRRLEVTEEEPESSLEARLGLVEEPMRPPPERVEEEEPAPAVEEGPSGAEAEAPEAPEGEES